MAVGTCVPLYTYPTDATWTTIISAKNAHPNVPIIAIINPASGPGASSDPNYVTGVGNLKAAGIKVLGYVATGYAGNSLASVESQIDQYKLWYAPNGIFFDEMQNTAGSESYYSTLTAYVKSHGMTISVGNPGTSTLTSYVGTVDMMFIYESSGQPSLASVSAATFYPTYNKSNFGIIPYNVPSLDTAFVTNVSTYVDWIYITNDNLPNPWDTLPPYFGSLVAALDVGGPALSTLTVSTHTAGGADAPGYFIDSVVDATTSTTVGSGVFTTSLFTSLTTGDTFRVTVDDFGPYYISAASAGTFERVTAGGGGAGRSTFTLPGNTTLVFTISLVPTASAAPILSIRTRGAGKWVFTG